MPKSKKMKKGAGWFDGLTGSTNISSATSGSWWNWGSTKKTPSYPQTQPYVSSQSQPQSQPYSSSQTQSQPQTQPYSSSSMMKTDYSYGGRKRRGKARGGSSLADTAAPISNSHTAKAHWVGGKRTRKHKKNRKTARKH